VVSGQGPDRRGDRNAGAQVGCGQRVAEPAGVEGDDARPGAAREVVGLAVDVLGQFATEPLARQALVCGYALLPETQAGAAAAAIARSLGRAQLGWDASVDPANPAAVWLQLDNLAAQ
jgi:GntR family transcriptional regulator / MocR family aminotransferase